MQCACIQRQHLLQCMGHLGVTRDVSDVIHHYIVKMPRLDFVRGKFQDIIVRFQIRRIQIWFCMYCRIIFALGWCSRISAFCHSNIQPDASNQRSRQNNVVHRCVHTHMQMNFAFLQGKSTSNKNRSGDSWSRKSSKSNLAPIKELAKAAQVQPGPPKHVHHVHHDQAKQHSARQSSPDLEAAAHAGARACGPSDSPSRYVAPHLRAASRLPATSTCTAMNSHSQQAPPRQPRASSGVAGSFHQADASIQQSPGYPGAHRSTNGKNQSGARKPGPAGELKAGHMQDSAKADRAGHPGSIETTESKYILQMSVDPDWAAIKGGLCFQTSPAKLAMDLAMDALLRNQHSAAEAAVPAADSQQNSASAPHESFTDVYPDFFHVTLADITIDIGQQRLDNLKSAGCAGDQELAYEREISQRNQQVEDVLSNNIERAIQSVTPSQQVAGSGTVSSETRLQQPWLSADGAKLWCPSLGMVNGRHREVGRRDPMHHLQVHLTDAQKFSLHILKESIKSAIKATVTEIQGRSQPGQGQTCRPFWPWAANVSIDFSPKLAKPHITLRKYARANDLGAHSSRWTDRRINDLRSTLEASDGVYVGVTGFQISPRSRRASRRQDVLFKDSSRIYKKTAAKGQDDPLHLEDKVMPIWQKLLVRFTPSALCIC